jgi:hypothetical protein
MMGRMGKKRRSMGRTGKKRRVKWETRRTRKVEKSTHLPLVKGERSGLAEKLSGVLRLGLLRRTRLLLLLDLLRLGLGGGLLLLGGLSLRGLSLLLGGSEDDSLLNGGGLDVAENREERLLVEHGLPEADGVGVGLAELGVEDVLESAEEDRGDEDVTEGDALRGEEGAGLEGLLEVGEVLLSLGLGGVDGDLVVGGSTGEGAEPGAEGGEKVGVGPCRNEVGQYGVFLLLAKWRGRGRGKAKGEYDG